VSTKTKQSSRRTTPPERETRQAKKARHEHKDFSPSVDHSEVSIPRSFGDDTVSDLNGAAPNPHDLGSPASNGVSPNGVGTPIEQHRERVSEDKTSASPNGAAWHVIWLSVEDIASNPFQPRRHIDAAELDELVSGIKAHGVQQPILVRTGRNRRGNEIRGLESTAPSTIEGSSNGQVADKVLQYELVAGERRLIASKMAKCKLIPAILRDDLSDADAAEIALYENVQRSDLTCIDEARGYKRLMIDFHLRIERIAKRVGKSVTTIKELLKLLQLPESVQTLLGEKKLTAAHGYALLALSPFEPICTRVAEKIVQDKLTAASLEKALLPNFVELKKQGLLVELDYKTKFNWGEVCAQCAFHAYVRSDFRSFCMKPAEWSRKQHAAIEQGEMAAAQAMEAARQQNSNLVEAESLQPGSYRTLWMIQPPAGCSPACPCYRATVDAKDPTIKKPICVDPARHDELVRAEKAAEENKRRLHYNMTWGAAKDKLAQELQNHDMRRLAALLAIPLLHSMYDEFGYEESWRDGIEEVAKELDIPIVDAFLDAEGESEAYAALYEAMAEDGTTEKVLLLCACLLLAVEARISVHQPRATPALDFVLERVDGAEINPELPIEDLDNDGADEEGSDLDSNSDMETNNVEPHEVAARTGEFDEAPVADASEMQPDLDTGTDADASEDVSVKVNDDGPVRAVEDVGQGDDVVEVNNVSIDQKLVTAEAL
jgi:ParB/RepB/Spo0J family partition protein